MTRFDSRTLALMVVGVVINFVGGKLIAALKLPLYLDSIGTVLTGVLAGPIPGALTGVINNVLLGVLDSPTWIPFALTAAAIGLLAGYFGANGWMKSPARVALAGLITGVVAALISAPIATIVFGGVTGGGTDALVAFFRSTGLGLWQSVIGQGIVSDPLDKLITYLIVFAIVRALPRQQVLQFPQGDKVVD
ncbi:energy-coupling factor transport system substrate-specific component [Ardenticatena maritima]|uniref:Energy-coupling factor transport system substrate-specific component n=1 Tax=Ardenticatena maritima TaxID=872965 RepID=A0A0M8K684_9CHLR|nr:histidine kinase [Ardenticatena maritima]KPL88601.1 hypothetical protein SE16_07545 [Ardenticatena maritima]GAP61641.1 energy-coupling factor transport system substrate-specific component [Ardenticatena maritima]